MLNQPEGRNALSKEIEQQHGILIQLQVLDEHISQIKNRLNQIPIQQQKLENELKSRKAELEAARAELTSTEKKLRELEMEIKGKEDEVLKAQAKMMEVKTNKEYQAAIGENEVRKQQKVALEEEALKLMTNIDALKTDHKKVEAASKIEQDKILRTQKEYEVEQNSLLSDLKKREGEKQSLTPGLDNEIGKLYRYVSGHTPSRPISTADQGKCASCNMKIPPQKFNEMLGFHSIHRCNSCGRILVLPQADMPSENNGDSETK